MRPFPNHFCREEIDKHLTCHISAIIFALSCTDLATKVNTSQSLKAIRQKQKYFSLCEKNFSFFIKTISNPPVILNSGGFSASWIED
jgi:hypothetical protein